MFICDSINLCINKNCIHKNPHKYINNACDLKFCNFYAKKVKCIHIENIDKKDKEVN